MSIDWKKTQRKLNEAGFAVGVEDGVPGRATYGALIGYAVRRQPDTIIRAIAPEFPRWLQPAGIMGSANRLAEFIAQTAHESGNYRRFEENMHYSAKRLMQVWPRRFKTLAAALPYAWDPGDPDREDVALANLVYGSRMGNEVDGTADNDGWDHRGSGMLQHTGAGEYKLLKDRLGSEPDDVRDPAKSVRAAADYWQRRNVNALIDRGDFAGARKAVNGGVLGLAEIADTRTRALKVLS